MELVTLPTFKQGAPALGLAADAPGGMKFVKAAIKKKAIPDDRYLLEIFITDN
ncbi:MAG: hypothetical protein F2895_02740 [Actinobacteria bacterium]|nr:hypothetical protein [Actinomycetota bacterium]